MTSVVPATPACPTVRTITHFVCLASATDEAQRLRLLQDAVHSSNLICRHLQAAGYPVQTVRLATDSPDLWLWGHDGVDEAACHAEVSRLERALHEHSCHDVVMWNVGAVAPTSTNAGRLVRLLSAATSVSASMPVTMDMEACRAAATVVAGLAGASGDGMHNFRFAATCSLPPGTPFFPAAAADAAVDRTYSIGLQHGPMIIDAVRAAGGGAGAPGVVAGWDGVVAATLRQAVTDMHALLAAVHDTTAFRFIGFDTSLAPAPLPTHPLTALFQAAGVPRFGSPGTLAAASRLTAALKSVATAVPTVGYCGLMLPPMEDVGLAADARAGAYRINDLLMASAVCGIGLDTVPIPGDTSVDTIAAIIGDVAALSTRLSGKPLSVRLFPVPHAGAGDTTTFHSPYLCSTTVFAV